MSNYRLFVTDQFNKSLRKIDPSVRKKIKNKLDPNVFDELKNEPHFGSHIKKLKNYDPETWRYRIGKFRLFYHIDEDEMVIVLLTIEDRKDAY